MARKMQMMRLLLKEGSLVSISPALKPTLSRALCTASPHATESDQSRSSFQGGWQQFKENFKFDSKDHSKKDFQKMADRVWQEVKEAVLPKQESLSATRARTDTTPLDKASFQGPSHIVQAKQKETLFSRLARRFHKQFESNAVYSRLRGLTNQGKEMAEDIKDRMESSDHPMMHKIQVTTMWNRIRQWDYHESFTREAEAAQVMREILKRDPQFNMVNFLRSIKEDVAVVVKAYLEGNEKILRQHCTDDLLEKLMGLYRHSEAQGTFQDSTLLFINDVELLDAMFVEKQPVIVATFSCQQINCMRDKFGNVVEGKEDEIQQVYYAWALEQDEQGAFDTNGKVLPPRWQLREMMIRGFHALL